MTLRLLGLALIAGAYLVSLTVIVAVRVATRPRPVQPDPPTMELGPEPPAVVNLLLHRDRVTVAAAEATLLDLAGRHVLELWSADGTGANTIVRLRRPDPTGLTAYEARVLQRVTERAVQGSAPLGSLAFDDDDDANGFLDAMHQDVLQDAYAHGLVEPRPRILTRVPFLCTMLGMVANIVGFVVVVVSFHQLHDPVKDLSTAAFVGLLISLPLFGAYGALIRNRTRLTRAGYGRAGHWLGVRDWLRSFPTFADLPPEATAVWDRYLAYGAALDATPSASEAVNLGYGGAAVLWSRYTGQWRRVRAGKGPWVISRPLIAAVVGCVVGGNVFVSMAFVRSRTVIAEHNIGTALRTGLLVAAVPWLYLLARYLIDVATPIRITGEVLRVDAAANEPVRDYLIDTGTGDVARIWRAGPLVTVLTVGDVVEATCGRWRRRLVSATVVRRDPEAQALARPDRTARDGAWIVATLPAAEIGAALGQPMGATVDGRVATYRSTVDGRAVLTVELRDRGTDPASWSAHPVGWALPGVGEEGYCGPGWAVARYGDEVTIARCWPPLPPQTPARALRTLLANGSR